MWLEREGGRLRCGGCYCNLQAHCPTLLHLLVHANVPILSATQWAPTKWARLILYVMSRMRKQLSQIWKLDILQTMDEFWVSTRSKTHFEAFANLQRSLSQTRWILKMSRKLRTVMFNRSKIAASSFMMIYRDTMRRIGNKDSDLTCILISTHDCLFPMFHCSWTTWPLISWIVSLHCSVWQKQNTISILWLDSKWNTSMNLA